MPFLEDEELYLSIAIEEVDDDCENVLDGVSEAPKKHPEGSSAPHKRSMRAAINQMCKECIYDDEFKGGGTWRMQTAACTVTKCPLWEFRPVDRPRKVKTEE